MRVINYNVNGLRSAVRKGFLDWVMAQDADIICLQETRLAGKETEITLPGYHAYYAHAEKPGYSGVALWTRREPDQIITNWGYAPSQSEGRYIAALYGSEYIASIYMPSGTSGEARQEQKYAFMHAYLVYLQHLQKTTPHILVAGDWNIAHTCRDIKNWKSNQDHTGFLPEERAWLDRLFQEVGYKDAFRLVNDAEDQYTWWSNRGRARENNVGWRIDYQVASPTLAALARTAEVYKETWFSDHAPLTMDYDLSW